MKKRYLAIFMGLCLSCAPFGAYAEEAATEAAIETATEAATEAAADDEVTAESLLNAANDAASMSGTMKVNLDAGIEITGEAASSMDISMGGDFDMQMIVDPMQLALEGTYHMSILGEEQDLGLTMYAVMSEDYETLDTYVLADDGTDSAEWLHYQSTGDELRSALGIADGEDIKTALLNNDFSLSQDLELDWTLEETDAGYVVSSQLGLADIMDAAGSLVTDELEQLGVSAEAVELFAGYLDGIVVNLSYTFDKETKLPSAFHMDLNDSDLTAINDVLSGLLSAASAVETTDGEETEQETETEAAAATIAITLDDFSVDGSYTYDDVTEIQIPADALTAPVESIEDLTDSMTEITTVEDTVEDVTEADSAEADTTEADTTEAA